MLAERLQASMFVNSTIPEVLDLIDDYRSGILEGYYNLNELPESWYISYYDSFASEIATSTTSTNPLLTSYASNLSEFSSAKLYNQTFELTDISRFIDNEEDFDVVFNNITNKYSNNWLGTEKLHTYSVGNASESWQQGQRSDAVFGQYVTVGDGVVRPEHQALNGIIERKDSKWWNTYFPPNGYNCRCVVSWIFDKEDAIISPVRTNSPKIDKGFDVNWGTTKYVFPKDHSYFTNSPKSKLNNNFGLPKLN